MKILIVDDNIAIQEILGEILSVDGWETEIAGSVEEALGKIASFRPDAVLLDSVVRGRRGMEVIESLPPDSGIRALILTSGKEAIPKDSRSIYGTIRKPFKSADVLEKVRQLGAESEVRQMRSRRTKFRLFGRSPQEKPDSDMGLRFGKSYVVFEDEPDTVYKMAASLKSKGCDILVVTAGRVKSISERFKDDPVRVLGLSPKARIGYIEMNKLGTLMGAITDFIAEAPRPVVVVDNLEPIVEVNGLNNVLTMVYQIINGGASKVATLIVSTGEGYLTDKDRALLTHDMELYSL